MEIKDEEIIEKPLEEYQSGKITLWQAARKSGITLWEMIDEVQKRCIQVPYGIEDLRDDLKIIIAGESNQGKRKLGRSIWKRCCQIRH